MQITFFAHVSRELCTSVWCSVIDAEEGGGGTNHAYHLANKKSVNGCLLIYSMIGVRGALFGPM